MTGNMCSGMILTTPPFRTHSRTTFGARRQRLFGWKGHTQSKKCVCHFTEIFLYMVELFWVFFPDAREVLHEYKAFNNENSAIPHSFDHLLNSRRFHGYVYKEENVYGDRKINEYVSENALMQLLESHRIKDKIRDFELDMWTY